MRVFLCRLALLLALAPSGSLLAQEARRFTVADSIGWRSIVEIDPEGGGALLFSPDRRHFLIQVAGTRLEDNSGTDELLSFDMQEVRAFVSGHRPELRPRRVALVGATREAARLSGVEWLSNDEIGFIAQGVDGLPQAYVARLGGIARPVTRSALPVAGFARAGAQILYYAHDVPVAPAAIGNAQGQTLYDILFAGRGEDMPVTLHRAGRDGALDERFGATTAHRDPNGLGIWPSPDGRRSILLVPPGDIPAHWAEYRTRREDRRYRPGPVLEAGQSPAQSWQMRFALLDHSSGRLDPLFDAPSGAPAAANVAHQVHWIDDRHVIVVNSFLPLGATTDSERERRRLHPAIAEVDLDDGSIRPILWLPVLTREEQRAGARLAYALDGTRWDAGSETLVVTRRRRALDRRIIGERVHHARRDGWRESAPEPTVGRDAQLVIALRQGLNQRPLLHARDGAAERIVYDPNPGADAFAFGHAEIFEWTEPASGIGWKGGLVYPVDHRPGRRYPLIVQTHGFSPESFLLDGPVNPRGGMTAMAAQAFANAGFVILQVEDNARTLVEGPREGELVAAGINAAVANLAGRGLVDTSRVGLIGFSRTGWHALYVLRDFPGLVRAASISDSVQANFSETFLGMTNHDPGVVARVYGMAGIAQDRERYASLIRGHPLYNLRAPIPVRLESNSIDGLLPLWETYSVLRHEGWPVELTYYREGSHVQFRPLERMASQGRTLDWFRFWLQGYVDPDPAKAAQYDEWRSFSGVPAGDPQDSARESVAGERV